MSESDIGVLARIDKDQVASAAQLVERGQVYDLGMTLSRHSPTLGPDYFLPFSLINYRTPEDQAKAPNYSGYSFSSDALLAPIHISTHIDGLIHAQDRLRTFGDHDSREIRGDFGWLRNGAETIPPIVCRGVLVDVAGHLGQSRLEDGFEITPEHLQGALRSTGTILRKGDAVLVRTGKIQQYDLDPSAYGAGEPGPGLAAADWLYEQDISLLGADNHGVEVIPFRDGEAIVHRRMLVERGVHLLENVYLEAVARDSVYEFLFVCLPLKITGATGSWVRPIAVA